MDLESPVDAWYVWLGVTVVSLAVAGIAVGLPAEPPPDATAAANAIDGVAGSPYEASGEATHDATEVRIDGPHVSFRNDHGTTHASLAYGPVVPVMGEQRLERLAAGEPFESVYEPHVEDDHVDAAAVFLEDVEAALEANEGEWRRAEGRLAVRTLEIEPQEPDPRPYASVTMVVSELDGGSTEPGTHGNRITEVSLEYESNVEADATVGVGGHVTRDEFRTERERVTFSPDRGTVVLDTSSSQFHNYLDGRLAELTVELDEPLATACTDPISNTSVGATATCHAGDPGNVDPRTAGEVADRLEWIELDPETGAAGITLVDA